MTYEGWVNWDTWNAYNWLSSEEYVQKGLELRAAELGASFDLGLTDGTLYVRDGSRDTNHIDLSFIKDDIDWSLVDVEELAAAWREPAIEYAADQLIDRLCDLPAGDPEATHHEADDAIMEFLRFIGHDDVADAWEDARERLGFWYS